MYRVFLLQRPGGQKHIDFSQNVLSRLKALNRQLERKGKKKRDFWRLIWFGEHLDLHEARKLQNKMQRSTLNPGALRKLMEDNKEKSLEAEIEVEEMPEQ
jgi:hypothetical protein